MPILGLVISSMPRRFAIGPWVLDAELNTVCRDGRVIRLEPKVVEVCACLAERAGEVVRKEELIRAVWPDIFVTDDVLTKAISELRKALEDDAKHPQFIETIPKRGYRLLAPDRSKSRRSHDFGEPQIEPSDVKGAGSIGISVAGSLSPTTIQPISPTIGGNPAACALDLKPAKTTFAFRWVAVPALGIVVLGLAVTAWWFFSRNRHALTEKDTIVLADFSNKTDDPVFDGTLRQGLSVQLEQSPFLSIVSDDKIQQTLQMMDLKPDAKLTPSIAREVCQRRSAAAVLDGSIAQVGTRYLLILKAVSCSNGQLLTSTEAEASDKDHVLDALGKAALETRKNLGESLASIQKFDAPLAPVTTSSLEALKTFSVYIRGGGLVPPFPTLLHVIELDPNFADAYAQLADAYSDIGESELASEYAQKAFERRDRVSERERLSFTAKYSFYTLGDLDQELRTYQVWKQIYPRDWRPWNDAASNLRGFGEYDHALREAQEALRLNPDAVNPYLNVGFSLLCLERKEGARQIGERALGHGMDVLATHLLTYQVAFLDNDKKQMEAQLAPFLGAPGKEAAFEALLVQSSTEAYFGRLRSSLEFSRRALEIARLNGYHEVAAQVQAIEALHEAEFGDFRRAMQTAGIAHGLSSGRTAKLFTSLALARIGKVRTAQALADELDRKFQRNTLMQGYWLPTIRGAIELARKNPAKAVDALKSVSYELGDTLTFVGNLYPAYVRGQAYLGTRQGKEAAAEFQKFLDHRSIVLNSPLGALARLGLARAYSLQGDTAKARGAYQDFLALWKDADPDVPILKEAKAEYAKLQ
jgi:eukaryotic-like serine/threonine-protein kinase